MAAHGASCSFLKARLNGASPPQAATRWRKRDRTPASSRRACAAHPTPPSVLAAVSSSAVVRHRAPETGSLGWVWKWVASDAAFHVPIAGDFGVNGRKFPPAVSRTDLKARQAVSG